MRPAAQHRLGRRAAGACARRSRSWRTARACVRIVAPDHGRRGPWAPAATPGARRAGTPSASIAARILDRHEALFADVGRSTGALTSAADARRIGEAARRDLPSVRSPSRRANRGRRPSCTRCVSPSCCSWCSTSASASASSAGAAGFAERLRSWAWSIDNALGPALGQRRVTVGVVGDVAKEQRRGERRCRCRIDRHRASRAARSGAACPPAPACRRRRAGTRGRPRAASGRSRTARPPQGDRRRAALLPGCGRRGGVWAGGRAGRTASRNFARPSPCLRAGAARRLGLVRRGSSASGRAARRSRETARRSRRRSHGLDVEAGLARTRSTTAIAHGA